jgi:GAF domain-containing protein
MDDATVDALLRLRSAARTAQPRRVGDAPGTALLQSIVDAAATLFEAEAASIALFESDPDRLEFHVAAGAQGAGVVGLSVPPTRGIAGYVFSTGEAIALSDVTSDPRFDRATAERTGYVPRSIAAVPLSDAGTTVGVLQVLDRQGPATFSLTDMSRLGVFASQAGVAIRASRVARDSGHLLRDVLARQPEDGVTGATIDAGFAAASAGLDREDEAPFWVLVDRLVAMRARPESELGLASDLLAVLTGRRTMPGRYRRRRARGVES